MLDAVTAYGISSRYKEIPGLVLLLLMLSFRPTGLLGKATIIALPLLHPSGYVVTVQSLIDMYAIALKGLDFVTG